MFVVLRRIVVVAILVAASALVLAPSASAIAAQSTLPADGSSVPPPGTIRVIHDQGLNPITSSISVRDKNVSAVAGSTSYTTTLVPNDTIVFTPSAPLTDALSDYSVTAIGGAIVGSDSVTTNFSFTVDSIAPDAPVVTAVTDPVNASNQAAVATQGTAEPGTTAFVYITDQNTTGIGGSAPVNEDGSFFILVDLTSLAQGTLGVEVSARDEAFNVSASTFPDPIFKDSIAPSAPTAAFGVDPIGSGDQGSVTVSGTTAEDGLTVNVSVDDTNPDTPPVTGVDTSAGSAYSVAGLDLTSLNQGVLTATVTATDASGNVSAAGTDTADKELGAPNFVSSSPVADTTVAPPAEISVTYDEALAAGSSITVVDVNNDVVTGVGSTDGPTIVFTPDAPFTGAGSPYTVTSVAKDAVDNTEDPATTFQFAIDSTPPAAPVITSTDAEVRPSNVASFSVAGEAEADSTVEVTVTDGSLNEVTGSTTANSPWNIDLDVSSLANGTLTVTATATDAAANTSAVSAPVQVTKFPTEVPFAEIDRPVNGTYTPISGDFDGDGNTDIFWYAPGSKPDCLWMSRGDGTYKTIRRNVYGTYTPLTGDFDGDSTTDILWYAPGSKPDSLWMSQGDGTFKTYPTPVNGTYTPLTGDFTADGFTDIFFYRPGSGSDLMLLNNGDGSFEYVTMTVNGTYTPITGDFDGDHDTDILWYAPGSSPDTIWRSRGDGTFKSYRRPVNGTYTPITGDFDGDSTTDILWYAPGSNPDHVWMSQGDMTFKTHVRPINGSYQPIVGDFDQDDDTDIFLYAAGTAADYIFVSEGDGTFKTIRVTQDGFFTPITHDHDDDGDTDILWYAPGPAADELWLATLSGPANP